MRPIFQHLYDLLIHSNNQFLQGGLVLGIIGGIVAYARSLPMKGYHYVQNRFIITLDITNEDPAFFWLAGSLCSHIQGGLEAYRSPLTEIIMETFESELETASAPNRASRHLPRRLRNIRCPKLFSPQLPGTTSFSSRDGQSG
jgi:hypothetical protein